jgi:hypothetical protein
MIATAKVDQKVFWIVNFAILQGTMIRRYVTGSMLVWKLGDKSPLLIKQPEQLYATVTEAQEAIENGR